MPAVTTVDAKLVLTVDSVDYACQVIDAAFTPNSAGEGDTVPVACGGDPVSEPAASPVNGSITGTVYKDYSPTGITRALIEAKDTVVAYVYTEQSGTTTGDDSLSWAGNCRVPAFESPFAPSKFGRHPLALTVITAVPTFGTVA